MKPRPNRGGEQHAGGEGDSRRCVEMTCSGFDQTAHRPGSKAKAGRCSWTETCGAEPQFLVVVRYEDSGRAASYALCPVHHFRVHQHFSVTSPPTEELRHLLENWADGFARASRTSPAHGRDLHRRPDLTLGSRGLEGDETKAFLRSWRAGLVDMQVDGEFMASKARLCPPALHLVGRSGDGVALHTEYLIHIGLLAELVLDEQWSLGDLAFEQGEWDVLGFVGDRVALAVEAKARAHRPHSDSLESFRDSLMLLSDDPNAEVPANHRRKWAALAKYAASGPVEVLLAASGARWWLDARSDRMQLRVTPRPEHSARSNASWRSGGTTNPRAVPNTGGSG